MQNDSERGRDAIKYFHNFSTGFTNYKLTFDQLLRTVDPKNTGVFLDTFGFTIRSIEMRDGQVEDAMESLAEKSQGKVPTNSSFFQALSARAANLTFVDYVFGAPEIAAGTAKDLGKGIVAVGDATLDVLKTFKVIGPLLIVGAVVFIFYSKVKKVAS